MHRERERKEGREEGKKEGRKKEGRREGEKEGRTGRRDGGADGGSARGHDEVSLPHEGGESCLTALEQCGEVQCDRFSLWNTDL
mmetsp:Transcript_20202/g.44086  ORF Transcript_20202/g.44086 Transcript_20202/m.44086 type:complete len:84 (+) Transcript_20202:86-337(+)